VAEVAARKKALAEYRRTQAALSIDRDKNYCVFCYFVLGKERLREDIHHVYGRGKERCDWRESYRSLVGTCRQHHPLPIMNPSEKTAWIEVVLKLSNGCTD
jgi:hypothetical protein